MATWLAPLHRISTFRCLHCFRSFLIQNFPERLSPLFSENFLKGVIVSLKKPAPPSSNYYDNNGDDHPNKTFEQFQRDIFWDFLSPLDKTRT